MIFTINFSGQLSHDNKTTKDEHAGFATVEESDVGKSKTKNTGILEDGSYINIINVTFCVWYFFSRI